MTRPRVARRVQPRDSFVYLLRHGSVTTLEIERAACLASGLADRISPIDARLAELRKGAA